MNYDRKLVFLFPGQGAQYTGMGNDLWKNSPVVKEMFETASEVLKQDMRKLLFEESETILKETVNTQTAVTLMNCAVRQEMQEFGFESSAAAGFSVGELSALYDAGILAFEDCIRLARERGRLMSDNGKEITQEIGTVGMAAVIGLDFLTVKAVIEQHGIEHVYAANDNGPRQVAVSGIADRVSEAASVLKQAGARKVIPLKVSGPFHTPLLGKAADAFSDFLDEHFPLQRWNAPKKKFFSNVSGREEQDPAVIRRYVVDQFTAPVRWTSVMQNIIQMKYDDAGDDAAEVICFETGPGKVLTGLWRGMDDKCTCLPAGTVEHIRDIRSRLELTAAEENV